MTDRLQQWKQVLQPREIILSDGIPMLIRPVRLQNLIMAKRIPVTMLKRVEMLQKKAGGKPGLEEAVEVAELVDAVVMAAAVDPRVTVDGGEDSIALIDLPWPDHELIFEEAQKPAAALSTFPGRPTEPGGDPAAAPDGEGVRQDAE